MPASCRISFAEATMGKTKAVTLYLTLLKAESEPKALLNEYPTQRTHEFRGGLSR
jgi:hypothetical protein